MEHDLDSFATFVLERTGRSSAAREVIDLTHSCDALPPPRLPPQLCPKCNQKIGQGQRARQQHRELCLQTSVSQEPRSPQRRYSQYRRFDIPQPPPLLCVIMELERAESCS